MAVQPASPELSRTTASASSSSTPVVHDFLSSVPPPLTSVLANLAPHISALRHIAQIISWQSSWYEAWIALAAWWAICLLSESTLRYFLPVALYLTLSRRRRPRLSPSPATEESLQRTISDLSALHVLVPSLPIHTRLPTLVLLKLLVAIYVPYLILSYFLRLRVIIAILGSLFITWRAPWAVLIRSVLWQNPIVRKTLSLAWNNLTGSSYSARTFTTSEQTVPSTTTSSRFLFVIYENQRWWVGLDWTAALLPNERPSWCSASLHPISPPVAFSLPEPTTTVLKDSHGRYTRTKTVWRWDESDEWSVWVKTEGQPQSRVSRPVPRDDTHATVSGAMMSKVAARMKETSTPTTAMLNESEPSNPLEAVAPVDPQEEQEQGDDNDPITDIDGWIYGDNKWERQSARGGYSKYTRYRRWSRTAIAEAATEFLESGEAELGIHRMERRESIPEVTAATALKRVSTHSSPAERNQEEETPPSPQGVRQRIRSVLGAGRRSLDSNGTVPST